MRLQTNTGARTQYVSPACPAGSADMDPLALLVGCSTLSASGKTIQETGLHPSSIPKAPQHASVRLSLSLSYSPPHTPNKLVRVMLGSSTARRAMQSFNKSPTATKKKYHTANIACESSYNLINPEEGKQAYRTVCIWPSSEAQPVCSHGFQMCSGVDRLSCIPQCS